MSRWDSSNYDKFEEDEESRLLKKFYDYAEIEKKESERRRFLEVSDRKRTSVWGNRFVLSAVIQGAAIMGLTVALVLFQVVFDEIGLIQFLTTALDGPAKWFFFGYFMHITLVVSIAITAVFYNHLESNLGRSIRGVKKHLVCMQFFGMNLGGATATTLLIVAGFVGTGFIDVASGAHESQSQIMETVRLPIAGSALLFATGIICGSIAYVSTYVESRGPKINKLPLNESKYDRI